MELERKVYNCWPTKWMDAAVKAGFADDYRDSKGFVIFRNPAIMESLALFALELTKDSDGGKS